MDLALNNLEGLICHKTQQTKPNQLRLFESEAKAKQKREKNRYALLSISKEIHQIVCIYLKICLCFNNLELQSCLYFCYLHFPRF